MVSSTATLGADSLAADVASAATTPLQAPQPLPPTGFVSCPTQHGLGRSNDENLLQAIVSSISYRLEKLSLSDEPALESPTTTIRYPVYTATPAGTPSTPSRNSARPSLLNLKRKLFGKLSRGFKAGLQKSILKRGNTKKTKTPIPPLPVSPCSPVERQGSAVGQIVESRGGLSVSDANPYSRDTRFQELFDFTVRAPPTHAIVNITFLQPGFCDASFSTSSTVRTAGDEVADDTMDEDEQQPQSARSDSPMPMESEPTSPSSDATLVPESSLAPSEDSTCRDVPSSIPEPRDEIMSDEEQCSSNSDVADRTESADRMMIEAPSTESAWSTLFSREIDMDDAEDPKSPSRVDQLPMPDTNPGRDSAPVNFANVAPPELPPSSAQSLPTSSPSGAAESSSAVGGSRNVRPASTQRQAALIESRGSAPASTAGASSTSTVVDEVVVPSTQETKSTAGPSTPTPASSQMNPTEAQEQVPNAHASRVHEVLGKLRHPKQGSNSAKGEASEEAEARAFLARVASRRGPPKPQNAPSPPPPPSKSTQTEGSASRSLMEDIMASFGMATKLKSSQNKITAGPKPALPPSIVETRRQVAASPSGRAPSTVSATDKVLSSSPTSLPVVASRQPVPNARLPSSVVATGRQVAASPFGRAPSTLSATGEVNGPPGSISTQVGTPSEAAMDGVESRRRAIKGSRRVARAIAKTRVTWQMVQQKARQTQAALEAAQVNAAPSIPASSPQSEELRLSQQWHAAQPPPPPEAMPYINTDEEEYDGDGEEYDGDPDDIDAQIAWALSH